jgi:hypothetical protein
MYIEPFLPSTYGLLPLLVNGSSASWIPWPAVTLCSFYCLAAFTSCIVRLEGRSARHFIPSLFIPVPSLSWLLRRGGFEITRLNVGYVRRTLRNGGNCDDAFFVLTACIAFFHGSRIFGSCSKISGGGGSFGKNGLNCVFLEAKILLWLVVLTECAVKHLLECRLVWELIALVVALGILWRGLYILLERVRLWVCAAWKWIWTCMSCQVIVRGCTDIFLLEKTLEKVSSLMYFPGEAGQWMRSVTSRSRVWSFENKETQL